MNKTTGYTIVGSAIILGLSLNYAAMIEQGLVLQPAGSLQKGQVITTPTGHVNLGVIYAENKMVDVDLTIKTKAGDVVDLLSLKGINPYDYESLIINGLKDSIASDKPGYKVQYNMSGSIDNVTLSSKGTLIVRTYIKYASEYQPDYNFYIATRKYNVPEDEYVKGFILKKVNRLVGNSKKYYKKNLLLDGDYDYKSNREQ